MDFMHIQQATGKKLRILTGVDIFSHYSPVVDPLYPYRDEDLAQELE
jgi:hypothetical protein